MGLIPVSIALFEPKGIDCPYNFSLLAPPRDLLHMYKNNQISQEQYTQIYTKHLDAHVDQIYDVLKCFIELHPNKDIIFLCWEGPKTFCHRHLAADYLNAKFNLNIKEYPC